MSIEQRTGPLHYAGPSATSSEPTNLADLLERILDKGIVIAGDLSISLVDVELLTIKLRLLIASVDKAQEMGINWWRSDPWLSGQPSPDGEADSSQAGGRSQTNGATPELEQRLERIESALERLARPGTRTRSAKSSPG